MRPTEEELKRQGAELLAQLRTLRDEVRVDLHLAGMEVRTRFEELEPKIAELEQVGRDFTAASMKALDEVFLKVREVRDSLRN